MVARCSEVLVLLWLFVAVQVVYPLPVSSAALDKSPKSIPNNEQGMVMPDTATSKLKKWVGDQIGYKRLVMPAYYARRLWPSASSRQQNQYRLHQAYAQDALRGLRKPAISTSSEKERLADKLFRASINGQSVQEYIPSEDKRSVRVKQLISLTDAKELTNRDYKAVYRIDGRGYKKPWWC